MKNIEVGDIVVVRESADSEHRLKRCLVLSDGPLVYMGLRTERTWFLSSQHQNSMEFDYFWEPESNLIRFVQN